MKKDPLKEALQKISQVRSEGISEKGILALQVTIRKQSGVVVAKAAELAADWNATELIKDLLATFYRLQEDGLNHDPQCWGKTAIIKALYELAHQDPKVFIDACRTVQLEPVYGGKSDTATSVRMAAIQVLVQLPLVDLTTVMMVLADLLADESAKVRSETVRACVYMQPLLVAPLLRLKIRLGDTEPRVMGVCFDTLLLLVPESETVGLVLGYASPKPVIKRFAPSHDVLQAEAVASLASSSVAEAIKEVIGLYPKLKDMQLQRVMFTALGVSPLEEAVRFLLQRLKEGDASEAKWALEALKSKSHNESLRDSIVEILQKRNDLVLSKLYQS